MIGAGEGEGEGEEREKGPGKEESFAKIGMETFVLFGSNGRGENMVFEPYLVVNLKSVTGEPDHFL